MDGYNANEVVAELQTNLENYDFPDGYTYEFTGEQQQQAEDVVVPFEHDGNITQDLLFCLFPMTPPED